MKFGRQKTALTSKMQDKLENLHKLECAACPLKETWPELTNPCMKPTGSDDPLVYVLAEAPDSTEDEKNKQLIGKTGILVRKQIPMEVKDLVRYNNTIRCRPLYLKANRYPLWEEVEACRPMQVRDIEKTKPKAIIAVGRIALNWAINRDKIGAWRGQKIPVQIGNHKCWLYPVHHPSYLYRQGNYKDNPLRSPDGKVFIEDINRVFDEIETLEEPEIQNEKKIFDGISIYYGKNAEFELDELELELLNFNENEDAVAIDIETNGLRPYKEGGKILSIAIGTFEKTLSIAFNHPKAEWTQTQKEKLNLLITDFLYNTQCKKVVHNAMFELEWFAYFLGHKIVRSGEWHDTQAQIYVLDGARIGAQALNDLTRLYLGFDLKNYSDIEVTNLENENIEKVLVYNGGDSKYTHKIFKIQEKRLKIKELVSVYKEQIRRFPTLVLAQLFGLDVDQGKAQEFNKDVTQKLKEIEERIKQIPEVIEYESLYSDLNFNSSKQLQIVLRDFIKAPEAEISKGKWSSAANVIEVIDHPFCTELSEYRRSNTLHSRYIKPACMDNESSFVWSDGKIHTSFNPMATTTRRLSSNDPNCFTGDTEVLTEKGWIKFENLKGNKYGECELLAQYNLDTEEISFTKPLEYIKFDFKGQLINIKSDFFLDITSTPEHEFYLKNRKTKNWSKVKAKDYFNDYQQPQAGWYRGGSVHYTEEQIILIAALQADGSLNKKYEYIDWSFIKERKVKRLIKALKTLNIKYNYSKKEYSNSCFGKAYSGTRYRIKINAPDWLINKKFFGDWVLSLDYKSLNFLSDEIFYWDGSFTRKNEYSSKDYINAYWVQILLNLTGKRARIVKSVASETGHDHWFVKIGKNSYSMTTNHKKSNVPYNGKVYCITMPLGTILIKQKGNVYVAGNCQNFPKHKDEWVRKYIVAPKNHALLAVDYSAIEARVIAMASKCKFLIDAFWDRYDIHQEWADRISKEYPEFKNRKDPRFEAKNGFVFASFFGGSSKAIAEKHLKVPVEVVQRLHKVFWRQFEEVKYWQYHIKEFYEENGYVESLTGFRRYAPLTLNQLINEPIQCTASDIVIDSMNRLSEYAMKENLHQFQAIINVHDDLTFSLPLESLEHDFDLITKYMVNVPFDFTKCVPIIVEAQIGDDWGTMEKVGSVASDDK